MGIQLFTLFTQVIECNSFHLSLFSSISLRSHPLISDIFKPMHRFPLMDHSLIPHTGRPHPYSKFSVELLIDHHGFFSLRMGSQVEHPILSPFEMPVSADSDFLVHSTPHPLCLFCSWSNTRPRKIRLRFCQGLQSKLKTSLYQGFTGSCGRLKLPKSMIW